MGKDFEQEWIQGFSDESSNENFEESTENSPLDIKPSNSLLILHLGSLIKDQFSKKSISEALGKFDFVYEEKGLFTLLDAKGNISFSLLNGKKPGTFLEDTTSDDVALVLDPVNLSSPLESFEQTVSIHSWIKSLGVFMKTPCQTRF